MDKKHLHHLWTKLRLIKPWYFLVLCAISTGVCIYALRANNLHMVQLKNDVYQADKNDGNVNAALKNLQAYVTSHMNTALSSGPNAVYPPIQLKYTYERLEKAEQTASSNAELYTNAENYCQALIPTGFSGRYRVPCIEQYINTHGVGQKAQPVPPSLYEFDFVAPWWSPDLAGWSLLASIVLLLLFIISWLVRHFVRRASK